MHETIIGKEWNIEKRTLEGHWYNERKDPECPNPEDLIEEEWDDEEFLTKLIDLECVLMNEYREAIDAVNNGEREIYNQYRKDKNYIDSYRGFSSCRLCGCSNGSREYRFGKFVWPEGFRHYITMHNVKPTDAFIAMIKSQKSEARSVTISEDSQA